MPEWYEWEGGLLLLLPALIPPFLLSYHKGWAGASLALAAAMATLALVQAEVMALDLPLPRWELTLSMVALLVAVSLGSGWIAESLLRARENAEASALNDALTGQPNRRHVTAFLDHAWAAAVRGMPVSVVLFDLDRFKRVNDVQGHAEGDRVIRAFADILKERTRRMDLSGRFGGEEFLTVLVDCGLEDARAFADAVRRRFGEVDFGWGKVTVSAGVSSVEAGMTSPDVLVAAADQALYRAKEQGRNCVQTSVKAGAGPVRVVHRAESPLPEVALDGVSVLLVDDDEATLRAMAKLLKRLGCVVQSAATGAEAIERVKADPGIQALVTDIVMPDMSGFTVVDLLARVRPSLPVLYISGYPQSEVYWGGTPGSRSAFLGKPVEVEELRGALVDLLAERPRAASAESPASVANGGGQESAGERSDEQAVVDLMTAPIMVVDDDRAVLKTLCLILEGAGHERVEGLEDPLAALERLDGGDFDLLVLDLHMPRVDGYEILQRLRQQLKPGEYFPVLVVTGDPTPEARRRALASGATDVLTKPFDPVEARLRVANLLRLRLLYRSLAGQRDRMEDEVRERTAELADTRSEILYRLALAAEYRDDVTGRHAARVGLLASRIASEIGMDTRVVDLIRRTAPLHDIGKIGVSDDILRKPGFLTDEEYAQVKEHTVIGAQILGRSQHQLLGTAREIALSHHERWDGGGYPHGLVGDEIPISARVVAVADTFDVLSHNRPYKGAVSPAEACREIMRCSGTHFDPVVAAAFEAVTARVGSEGLRHLADPIDPWRDTDAGVAVGVADVLRRGR